MAWLPAAIGAGGTILGGIEGNKGQKQAANDAANAQLNLEQKMFDQAKSYQDSQNAGLRGAIQGLIGGGNPFFAAGAHPAPSYLSPGANAAHFGGGSPQFGLPGVMAGLPGVMAGLSGQVRNKQPNPVQSGQPLTMPMPTQPHKPIMSGAPVPGGPMRLPNGQEGYPNQGGGPAQATGPLRMATPPSAPSPGAPMHVPTAGLAHFGSAPMHGGGWGANPFDATGPAL